MIDKSYLSLFFYNNNNKNLINLQVPTKIGVGGVGYSRRPNPPRHKN